MDLESEENAEKDEFFVECLSDPTLRDQMSILTRKFKNKMQVNENCENNVQLKFWCNLNCSSLSNLEMQTMQSKVHVR